MQHIRKRLQEYENQMDENGLQLNYKKLAEAIVDKTGRDVHFNTVKKIFREDSGDIKLDTLLAICDIFGISILDLLPNESNQKSYPVWDCKVKNIEGISDITSKFYMGKYVCLCLS